MRKKVRWTDLSPVQQTMIVVGGLAELGLTGAAVRDLCRRDAGGIRGSRWLWVLSFVVQPFGPLAYFALGRATTDR